MSESYDYFRQNPDIKEMARKFNTIQSDINILNERLASLVNSSKSGDISENRPANEVIAESIPIVPSKASETTVFSDSEFQLINNDDNTKIVETDASGITTGNTRTITMPDNDVTLLTTAEKAALHNIFVPALVAAHSDISSAGSGAIITSAERTALHAAYTDAAARTAADLLKLYSIATEIVAYPAISVSMPLASSIVQNATAGVYDTGTGTTSIFFNLVPPDWLVRYAVENSKTITATTLTIHWNNSVSASYIDRIIIYDYVYDAISAVSKYDNPSNLGSGTTGFTSSIVNFTDTVVTEGDSIIARIYTYNSVASATRILGFDVTFTLA